MRTVVFTDPGVLELNWMWLPTWIGMNSKMKQEIEREVAPMVEGQALTDKDLDRINARVIEIITSKIPFKGVEDYLDGLKFIDEA